jgi:glycerol-3-phosphate dehydrogenase
LTRRPLPTGGFSARTRAEALARFQADTFDIAIIGGGITGAGIARDAAQRGLAVALLEKGDFASGTSSKSSRMIHGGLRYLRQRHVHLVRESLVERGVLLRLAPHLVHPMPYLLPVYEGGANKRFVLRAGLTAYDLLAGRRRLQRHRSLSREALERAEPAIRTDGLQGGFRYFDCLVNDARLTLATARSAARDHAAVASYVEATGVLSEGGRVTGVHFTDRLNGTTGTLRAHVVVAAAGPWTDQVRALAGAPPILRPTKGIHVVVGHARLPVSNAVAFAFRDRMLFAVPYGDYTYIGTTDTDYPGDPGQARVETDDVAYVIEAANSAFTVDLSPDDVLSTWAGVRPLVYEEGTPSDVGRDYEIQVGPEGFITIAGGKLTTYRAMAEDLVDGVVRQEARRLGGARPPCRTASTTLPGGDLDRFERYREATAAALEEGWGLSRQVAYHLPDTYGTEYLKVLAYARHSPDLLRPLAPDVPVLAAEAIYAVEEEMALTLEDFMARRTDLMLFEPQHGLEAAGRAAALMGEALGWGRRQRHEQIERYREAVAAMTAFRTAGEQRACPSGRRAAGAAS